MKLALVAAAVAVVAVSGAAARSSSELRLLGISSPVISPNGNGVNRRCQVDYSLEVPAEISVNASTSAGAVAARGHPRN